MLSIKDTLAGFEVVSRNYSPGKSYLLAGVGIALAVALAVFYGHHVEFTCDRETNRCELRKGDKVTASLPLAELRRVELRLKSNAKGYHHQVVLHGDMGEVPLAPSSKSSIHRPSAEQIAAFLEDRSVAKLRVRHDERPTVYLIAVALFGLSVLLAVGATMPVTLTFERRRHLLKVRSANPFRAARELGLAELTEVTVESLADEMRRRQGKMVGAALPSKAPAHKLKTLYRVMVRGPSGEHLALTSWLPTASEAEPLLRLLEQLGLSVAASGQAPREPSADGS
jgi:hypothetical protein